jgi:hypothetical protein
LRNDCRGFLGTLQALTYLQTAEVGEKAALEAVIRKKAQDVITLLNDNDVYQMEREKARKLKANLTSVTNDGFRGQFTSQTYGSGGGGGWGTQQDNCGHPPQESQAAPPPKRPTEDDYYSDSDGPAPTRAPEPAPAPARAGGGRAVVRRGTSNAQIPPAAPPPEQPRQQYQQGPQQQTQQFQQAPLPQQQFGLFQQHLISSYDLLGTRRAPLGIDELPGNQGGHGDRGRLLDANES